MEGIAAAKGRGVYKGRKPTIDPVEVRRLHAEEGLSPSAIARWLGIARSSVCRFLPQTDLPGEPAKTDTVAVGDVSSAKVAR